MTAYRKNALVPIPVIVDPPPAGLVRANGARCTCTPPGFFWRWWHQVQRRDRWYCTHGCGWKWAGQYEDGSGDSLGWRLVMPSEVRS